MSILAWILLGLIAGAVAGFAFDGRREIVGNLVVGTLGALIAGFFASALMGWDVTLLNGASLALAAVGAVAMIATLRMLPEAETYQ